MVGHAQHQMVAEFPIGTPKIVSDIGDIEIIETASQNFATVIDRVDDDNPDGIGMISGLSIVSNKLVANVAHYYDAVGDNTDTTVVFQNRFNLADSEIVGFLKLDAKHHAAGWITPIPQIWQDKLLGTHIAGHASNQPINLRSSMGPSAFSLAGTELINAKKDEIINTNKLLDYPVKYALHPDTTNANGENDIWTELSKAHIGFIVPGTYTYAVFGSSGGHESGVGYKIHGSGGWAPNDLTDTYNYYWLYDVREMVNVLDGSVNAYDLRPYEHGELHLPHEDDDGDGITNLMIGASFDPVQMKLYFLLGDADTLQSAYENIPLLLAYSIKISRPKSPILKVKN